MRARYYDPQIGRFASQDPAKLEKNFFAYAENNPISKVDANGRLTIEEWQAWMQNWQDIELGVGGTARNPGVGSLADVVRAAGGSIQILMKLDFDFEATAANGIGISSTTAAYAAYRARSIAEKSAPAHSCQRNWCKSCRIYPA
jgi:uncharacterized protein RhaS with RHS repeats